MGNNTGKIVAKFAFEELDVWSLAIELARDVYAVITQFPTSEQYALSSQLRRAVVSISANIAEGKGRWHKKEFVQFLYVARGSLYETVSLLAVAKSLGYIDTAQFEAFTDQCDVINRKLSGLVNHLRTSSP